MWVLQGCLKLLPLPYPMLEVVDTYLIFQRDKRSVDFLFWFLRLLLSRPPYLTGEFTCCSDHPTCVSVLGIHRSRGIMFFSFLLWFLIPSVLGAWPLPGLRIAGSLRQGRSVPPSQSNFPTLCPLDSPLLMVPSLQSGDGSPLQPLYSHCPRRLTFSEGYPRGVVAGSRLPSALRHGLAPVWHGLFEPISWP
jgi:hypothetical protein